MEKMADLLGGRAVESKTAAPSVADNSLNRAVKPPQAVDAAPIISKLPSNNERFCNLIARFATRLDEQLKTVEQACKRGKYDEIAAFAHWLKGSGGTVGFDDFTAPASKLETLAREGGSDADVSEVITDLRGLAARLVIPGNAPQTPSPLVTASSEKTVSVEPMKTPRPIHDEVEKPLTSRLEANPRFHRVICQFVEKLKEELGRAQRVWEKGDMQALAMIAHWLKGAGGTVGFDDFTAPAAKLEAFAKAAQVEQAGQVIRQLEVMSEANVPPTSVQADTTLKRSIENKQYG